MKDRKDYWREYARKNAAKRRENLRRWAAANRAHVNEYAREWQKAKRARLGVQPRPPRKKRIPAKMKVVALADLKARFALYRKLKNPTP